MRSIPRSMHTLIIVAVLFSGVALAQDGAPRDGAQATAAELAKQLQNPSPPSSACRCRATSISAPAPTTRASNSMICLGMLEVNLTDGTQQGWGRCMIATSDGDRLYAGWSCTGKHLEGCGGPFNVSGGTGKFSGVSGQSTFVVQSLVD